MPICAKLSIPVRKLNLIIWFQDTVHPCDPDPCDSEQNQSGDTGCVERTPLCQDSDMCDADQTTAHNQRFVRPAAT